MELSCCAIRFVYLLALKILLYRQTGQMISQQSLEYFSRLRFNQLLPELSCLIFCRPGLGEGDFFLNIKSPWGACHLKFLFVMLVAEAKTLTKFNL